MFIFQRKFYLMLAGILILTLLFSIEVQAQPVLSDICGNWAQKSITDLVSKSVINGYPDGTFKPEQTITRAEFAKLVDKTFNYQPSTQGFFPDASGHWAQKYINTAVNQKVMHSYADGTFRPQDPVSRDLLATMLTRVLQLGKPEEKFAEDWSPSFTDVPIKHWAFRSVEIANKLGLFPPSFKTEFHPDQLVTRAEAVWTLENLSNLAVTKGKIASVNPDTGLVNVQNQKNGDPVLAMVTPETVVLRNNVTSDVDTLLNGDTATVIATPSGDVKFLKAFGQITKNDLLSRISTMTKGKITKDEISAVVAGDWSSVKDDLKGGLYNKMVDMGLTPAEAESIMVRDWNYLDTLSRDRLAQALSGQLGITQDFAQALLARDMQKIKDYGKIELATAALSKLLGVTDNGGNQANNNSY